MKNITRLLLAVLLSKPGLFAQSCQPVRHVLKSFQDSMAKVYILEEADDFPGRSFEHFQKLYEGYVEYLIIKKAYNQKTKELSFLKCLPASIVISRKEFDNKKRNSILPTEMQILQDSLDFVQDSIFQNFKGNEGLRKNLQVMESDAYKRLLNYIKWNGTFGIVIGTPIIVEPYCFFTARFLHGRDGIKNAYLYKKKRNEWVFVSRSSW